ncbi:MAG: DUF2855 family protein [Burkholderiales bacterium]|nr:DUF2855 family protein [Burkholderiales bacterium]
MTDTPASASAVDFIVRRDNLHECKSLRAQDPGAVDLQSGQVLMRIDNFAFTANNITYAAFGAAMSYWDFFAAPEGWGRIPVWGFGDVIRSNHEAVKPGERYYGYYPMSTHVVLQAARAGAAGFSDGAEQRKALHPVYNQYLRTATDPGYDAGREDQQMLLKPLFVTSFLIDDFLADNAFFGARAVLLSSASSKTAYGTAFQLARRGATGGRCEIIGLTSPGNVAFVQRLGCYDRVLSYDQIESIPADLPLAYVDMAGNAELRSTLHHRFGDSLKYSCAVGGTHWDALGGAGKLPGPRPTLFFAPAQIKKRAQDWGAAEFQRRLGAAWLQFLGASAAWMRVIHARGPAAVERVYLEVLEGRARPDEGHVLTLFE